MILQYRVSSPVQAHEVLSALWSDHILPRTRHGAAVIVTFQTESDYLRLKHRALFHGPLLKAFSEQIWLFDPVIGRPRPFAKAVWKQGLKELFIEPEIEEYRVRRTGEIKFRLKKLSTEELPNDLYSDFIHQCIALLHELGGELPDEGY